MGLDLWFREDVLRILGAVHAGMSGSVTANPAVDSEYANAYRQGFEDAIKAVAVGFGIPLQPERKVQRWP